MNKITPICNIVLQQGLILVIRQSKHQKLYFASITNDGKIEHSFKEKNLVTLTRRAFHCIRQYYTLYSTVQSFNWSDGMPYDQKPIGF